MGLETKADDSLKKNDRPDLSSEEARHNKAKKKIHCLKINSMGKKDILITGP
jgi:hypothetical protein